MISPKHKTDCTSMEKILVSVIVPNYCHSKYLDLRLQSILSQSYDNFEVIILDDNSPDNGASKAIIEKYRNNPKISAIVYNEINSGSTFKQWEKGITLAKGELIWIAESDDYCEKDFLNKCVSKWEQNKTTSFVYTSSTLVDAENKILDIKDIAESIPEGLYEGKNFISEFMYKENSVWNASAVVFQKKFASSIDKDFMEFKSAGDHLFWIKLAELGPVYHLNEKLNYFRQHLQKVTPEKTKKGILHLEELKIFQYVSQKHGLSFSKKLRAYCRNLRSIANTTFDNKETRKQLLSAWKANNVFLYYISQLRIMVKKYLKII